MAQTIFTILGILVVFIIIFLILAERILKKIETKSRLLFAEERQQLLEHLSDKKDIIGKEIQNNKEMIKELVSRIERQILETDKKIEYAEKQRIGAFSKLKTGIDEHKLIAEKLRISTDKLQNILSNNQARGAYGEEVAENLLKMAGFVKGVNYDSNISQNTNLNRPDFTIYLPDKSKFNIDVKFPYQAFAKYQECKNKIDKKKYFAQFKADVRQKIKQITTRDYINPEEKTLDFVILFVPNEAIFSFINDKLHDLMEEANKKKVTIVGPVSFITLLRMIHQAYENFKIQDDLHRIIGLVNKFKQEFEKYSVEFNKLGDKITAVAREYNQLSGTRERQLTKVVNQISQEKKLNKLTK